MNNPPPLPNLDGQPDQELPVRSLNSPYFVLRTCIGGFYVDPQYNGNLVRKPVELLSKFLAGAQRVSDSNGGEIRYESKPNQRPLRYLHEGAIREFEMAARKFREGAASADQANLRKGFRLPDPGKEPDAYWVWGDRFKPQLMVLWGCEREEHSSLPLVDGERTVISELRAKAMTWMRLFREAIDLCKDNDPLATFLVFPVLNERGELTHIQRQVNGRYVTYEVKRRWYECWKIRPLRAVPARSIHEFRKTAELFYRKAHPSSCGCPACNPLNPSRPASTPSAQSALDYEQELRKGFRLPDPDQRPDAYLVIGPPFAGRILVLCPHPVVKDPEEIVHLGQSLSSANGKSEELRRQLQQDSAQHNLHKRFFYSGSECLCLTEDKALGLPVPTEPATTNLAVPPPTAPEAEDDEPDITAPTVVAKLWKRRIKWRRLMLLWAGIIGLPLLAWLLFEWFAPNQLQVATAEVTNSPVLDPDNQRNVLVVQFNNSLGKKLGSKFFGRKGREVNLGRYSLQVNGKILKLQRPTLYEGKTVAMVLDSSSPFEEGVPYQLTVENAADIWGNHLSPVTVPVTYVDKRPPNLVRIVPAAEDADNQLQVEFDEPLDSVSASAPANYLVPGMSIGSASLQKDRQTVLLKAEQPFDSGGSYTLCLRNITDASRAKNRMPDLTNAFTYAQVPLKVRNVSANETQTHIKVLFNRRIDRKSAQTPSTFNLDNLQIGTVTVVDDKSAELVFTNGYLMTNVTYALHIDKLKDAIGKPGTELSTNLPFRYTGGIDLTPALIQGASLVRPNCLQLSFNKELLQAPAEIEANYGLLVAMGQNQFSDENPIRLRPQLVSGRVVQLNLSQNLPYGSFRLLYHGLEDLMGNVCGTNAFFDFRNQGLRYRTKQCSDTGVSPDRTQVSFKLQFRLDKSGADPRNFRVESGDDTQVTSVELKPGENTTQVLLGLDRPIDPVNFRIRFINLKLEGDVSPQSGIVRPSQ